LIAKWLTAGVLEEGRLIVTEEGTPQGAAINPLLANTYLHHVYDLWVHHWQPRCASGHVVVVRYADDAIVGFEHRHEAEQFYVSLWALNVVFCKTANVCNWERGGIGWRALKTSLMTQDRQSC
jgi:retron-type reverse transcriptase